MSEEVLNGTTSVLSPSAESMLPYQDLGLERSAVENARPSVLVEAIILFYYIR